MIEKTVKRMELVEGTSGSDLMEKYNAMLDRLEGQKCSISDPVINLEKLIAYVLVTRTTKMPETLAEAHSLNGEFFSCSDCRFFRRDTRGDGNCDLRKRKGKVHSYADVCETFWELFDNGEDVLFCPRNKDGSINRRKKQGIKYIEWEKEHGQDKSGNNR